MLYKYLARKRSTAAKRVENGERQSSALGITREGRVVCFNSTRTTKLDLQDETRGYEEEKPTRPIYGLGQEGNNAKYSQKRHKQGGCRL